LSKGQARQLALLCAICHRPKLLILDEPGGGLDPAARREMLETSIHLLNEQGSAILFSSHYMGDVERLGGRVVLLDDGKVLVDEQIDSLREDHSMAVMPASVVSDLSALERLPGCLRVRRTYDSVHAVFVGNPERARRILVETLQISDAHCMTLPLEELFIELVGGERMVPAT
jgi:ABC-2 type transport system ATP-binding protein